MSKHIYDGFIVPGCILIPIFFGFYNYRFLNAALKIMLAFLIFSGVVNSVATAMAFNHIHNIFVLHMYTIFEFAFISWFYKVQFKGKSNIIIPVIAVLFTALCVVNSVFFQNYVEYNTYTRSLSAVIISGYSIMYFVWQLQNDSDIPWGDVALNWINTAILLFYSCSLVIFIFSNYLLNAAKETYTIIWNIYLAILLIEYVLFGIGFYKCKKQQTT